MCAVYAGFASEHRRSLTKVSEREPPCHIPWAAGATRPRALWAGVLQPAALQSQSGQPGAEGEEQPRTDAPPTGGGRRFAFVLRGAAALVAEGDERHKVVRKRGLEPPPGCPDRPREAGGLARLPGGASRPAALLVAPVFPIRSLLAPGRPGAAPGIRASPSASRGPLLRRERLPSALPLRAEVAARQPSCVPEPVRTTGWRASCKSARTPLKCAAFLLVVGWRSPLTLASADLVRKRGLEPPPGCPD